MRDRKGHRKSEKERMRETGRDTFTERKRVSDTKKIRDRYTQSHSDRQSEIN